MEPYYADERTVREVQYAEAIVSHDAETCVDLDDLLPEDQERALREARAVMVVANAEMAELRAEVERLRKALALAS
jgi:hypothetical protein